MVALVALGWDAKMIVSSEAELVDFLDNTVGKLSAKRTFTPEQRVHRYADSTMRTAIQHVRRWLDMEEEPEPEPPAGLRQRTPLPKEEEEEEEEEEDRGILIPDNPTTLDEAEAMDYTSTVQQRVRPRDRFRLSREGGDTEARMAAPTLPGLNSDLRGLLRVMMFVGELRLPVARRNGRDDREEEGQEQQEKVEEAAVAAAQVPPPADLGNDPPLVPAGVSPPTHSPANPFTHAHLTYLPTYLFPGAHGHRLASGGRRDADGGGRRGSNAGRERLCVCMS